MATIVHYLNEAVALIATAKKAVAGFVAAAVAVLAVPELGVDPDVQKALIALAVALGVWVAPKNTVSPGQGVDGQPLP